MVFCISGWAGIQISTTKFHILLYEELIGLSHRMIYINEAILPTSVPSPRFKYKIEISHIFQCSSLTCKTVFFLSKSGSAHRTSFFFADSAYI